MADLPQDPAEIRLPGNRTKARLTAAEDFQLRTLSQIPGVLDRLRYLASLRNESGAYEHWGMNRTYGWADALVAMADSHTEVFREALSSEVNTLVKDLESWNNREELLRSLEASGVVPANLGGGSERHWQYLLKTLAALAEALRAV